MHTSHFSSRRSLRIRREVPTRERRLELHEIIFHHAPEAILVMSSQGEIVECNPAAGRLFGLSPLRLCGESFFSLLSEEHEDRIRDIMQTELLLGSVFLRIPMRSLHKAAFMVEITLRHAIVENETRILAFITDVSEAQRIERALERRDLLLEVTRDTAHWLLRSSDWRTKMPEILSRLGQVFQADQVMVYRNENFSRGDALIRTVREFCWKAAPVPRAAEKCGGVEVIHFDAQRVQRWAQMLGAGETVQGNMKAFPPEEQQFLARMGAYHIILVPVFVAEQWWGMLTLQYHRSGQLYSQNDLESLQIVADMLGSAIQRQTTGQRLRNRQQALTLLSDITTAALQNISFQEPLQALARHLGQLMNAEGCYITLWDEELHRPVPAAAYGVMGDVFLNIRIESGEHSLTRHLLERGESLLIDDLQETPFVNHRRVFDTAVQTVLAIPMLGAGQHLGAVFLTFHEKYPLPSEERLLAEQAVRQVSLALTRLRLLRTTQRQLEELSILQKASAIAAQALSEEDLLQNFVETVGKAFYSDHFSIFLLNEGGSILRLAAFYHAGILNAHARPLEIPLEKGITGYVARTGKPYRCGDVRNDPLYVNVGGNIRSEVCVPVWGGERVVGVLNAESTQPLAFNESDERLLSTLAGHLGTALMRQRLFAAETQRRQEAETLQKVSAALIASLKLEDVLRDILVLLKGVVPYDSASIIMMSRDGVPRVAAQSGYRGTMQVLAPKRLLSRPHIRALLEQQQPIIIDDVGERPGWLVIPGTEYIRCWMGVPLVVQTRVVGWLNLDKKEPASYDTRMANLALAFANQAAIALENARLYDELETSYVQTVLALARAMDARDSYTADHSNRMAEMARAVAERMGCTVEEIQAVEWAALLHDIGKIGIPDHVLRKPASLTREEWEIMRRHPDMGAEIIAPVQRLTHVSPIVRAHQEKYDGTGYPRGLRGDEIPLGARILAVVDAYSAITDERVYRKARSHEEALDEIRRCAGAHFDPRVVEIFLDVAASGGEE